MPPLRTFILKVVNRCNINCDYCYVFNGPDQSWRGLPVRMSVEVAHAVARRIAEHATAHDLDHLDVVLHGGEPLLAGPRHLGAILQILHDRVPSVRFELQTNGTLLNDDWLDLFDRFDVRVGVSIDGRPVANDRHRVSHRGRSTSYAAVRGIELLRNRPHLFAGVLAVVDLHNDPADVHDYLASLGPAVIDFNLPHATHDAPPERTDPAEPEYGRWLSRVYDAWTGADSYTHSVRVLEDIVALSLGAKGSVESLGLAPADIVVVESDGSIENVDTLKAAAPGAAELGLNVFDHTFDEVADHPAIQQRRAGVAALAQECQRCPLVSVCGGGYLPHRLSAEHGYRNPSVYCQDLAHLIRHVQATLPA
ncbi:FxsB family radical SAM/SPASM domain protein [Micromonospora tulbaghiae]|uniref:FxsB family radical SAM/SPASM domain protein n=1 Tax=Micromonospora tulbaghiae TaxID=479978 RepID=A0AAW4JN01_9ACTN|nr:FxsB family cyclophane-forming radical SAM/SPASM peptide maturase [Micromonospora tulbaghiae]MBO4140191.1 FxsB family radical SAM/SPASM domain protein [Micromonospora tulbaghiae]